MIIKKSMFNKFNSNIYNYKTNYDIYKFILSEADFQTYNRIRNLRKKIDVKYLKKLAPYNLSTIINNINNKDRFMKKNKIFLNKKSNFYINKLIERKNKLLHSNRKLNKVNLLLNQQLNNEVDLITNDIQPSISTDQKIISVVKQPLFNHRTIFLKFLSYNKKLEVFNKKHINRKFLDKPILANHQKLIYLKNHIKLFHKSTPKSLKKTVYLTKPRFTLPWILQGRRKYKKLKYTLLYLFYQLIDNRRQIGILTNKDKKLLKQFKRSKKFGKFGRYGVSNKFFGKSVSQSLPVIVNKIKRQQLYLQHKGLSIINNIEILPYKYIYMLVVIWYLLTNTFLFSKKYYFRYEIWFNFFLKNLWIHQAPFYTDNGYLNYAIFSDVKSTPVSVNLYKPMLDKLNCQLIPLKNYERLSTNILNKKKLVNLKSVFKLKRKSKIRNFFKISPKLKNNSKFITNIYNKKKDRKFKISKKLSDKEWLLVNQFTRRKYQGNFSAIFSQLKNLNKIQKYIDKQPQVWHQPYFITHPYYYTDRSKTFIYQMSQG